MAAPSPAPRHIDLAEVSGSRHRSPRWPVSSHTYNLSRSDLRQGLQHLATAASLAPLVAQLEASSPISIGLLGASVGQDGGCLNQPGKRCHDYSGRVMTGLPWSSRRRYYSGFLVRFFDALNATWPHAEHRLWNAAQPATSLQSWGDCLAAWMPRPLDLVILELGGGQP